MNKKLFISIFAILLSIFSFAQNQKSIKLQEGTSTTKISVKSETEFSIFNKISDLKIQNLNLKSRNFAEINLAEYHKNNKIGEPNLPELSKLIEIPENAIYEINIISFDEQIIRLNEKGISNKISPCQPSLSKCVNSENAKFYMNEKTYATNDFIKSKLVDIENDGKMRGTRIGRLTISPFQYNPVTNTLKIINNLKFEVVFKNANLTKTREIKNKNYSPYFETSFNKLINHKARKDKDVISKYPIKYVIIADRMFEATLQPFINWKTKKGFTVIEAYTDQAAVGKTTTSIKNYIKTLYDVGTAESPAPTFVLFVGDVEQIPAFTGVSETTHVTDLYYCEIDGGTDYFPEMYYGRFSAKTVAQLQSQVNKTLQYEQYLMPDKTFLNEVVLVAGIDATYGPVNGNGQINYATDNYFNSAHGLNSHTYLYPNSETSISSIISDFNAGASFVNYTAHCDWDGWADPSFTVTDIPNLTNVDKYPFVLSNCCLANKFDVDECFTEGIVRAENKGAVAAIGGSNSTLWDEDFYWSVGVGTVTANPTYATTSLGAYDRMFHENGEAVADWYVTGGQIVNAGNLAVTQSSSGSKLYYWEIYHIIGDPSLTPFIGVPNTLTINYQNSIPSGTPSIQITTEPNTYVALSYNGILYDAVLSNNLGIATLNTSSLLIPCTATIVATKQNKQPYIGNLEIVPNNSAYVVYNSNLISDLLGNNNAMADFGETVSMSLNLKNVGSLDANSIIVQLSTSDSKITLTDDSTMVSSILASATISTANSFSFSVADNVEDNHVVQFQITCTDANDSVWISNFSIQLNAPNLSVEFLLVDDANGNNNGRLDLNETVNLNLNAKNIGGADINNVVCSISTASPYITLNSDTVIVSSLLNSSNQEIQYNISVSPTTPIGTSIDFVFDIVSGNYFAQITKTLKVGLIVEDWESNSFISYDWVNSGWQISTSNVYEGTYSANSGTTANSGKSSLELSLYAQNNDTISFYKKVSSEDGYDFLRFYIDGVEQLELSGEIAWSISKFPVTAGNHTFKWLYSKDVEISSGSDMAFVDFISLPAFLNVPKFTSYPSGMCDIDELYTYNISVIDEDLSDIISISCSNLPSWLNFVDNGNGTAVLSGTPTLIDDGTFNITIVANDGTTDISQTFSIIVGAKIEDWENNNFSSYKWINSSTSVWTISNVTPYEGIYSAKSGNIDHNGETTLSIELYVTQFDSIKFYKKVSSEESYDFLHFSIDGIEQNSWSGNINWSYEAFLVDSGLHTFEWKYTKDVGYIGGSDCAWIDYIVFPKFDNTVLVESISDVKNNIHIYPNPCLNFANFDFKSTETENINLEIFNSIGQVVKTQNLDIKIGQNQFKIDTSNLNSGIYYFNTNLNKQAISKKITIIK